MLLLKGIRASPNVGTISFLGGLNSAILRYSGAPNADPITLGPIYLNTLQETNLHVGFGPCSRVSRLNVTICFNSPLRTLAQYVHLFYISDQP